MDLTVHQEPPDANLLVLVGICALVIVVVGGGGTLVVWMVRRWSRMASIRARRAHRVTTDVVRSTARRLRSTWTSPS